MSVHTPVTGQMPGFSEATRAWFGDAFAMPTPAQAEAWAAIGRGDNTLVIAPTGSGKTLAAFLWAIDKLATEPVPADPRQRCRVLYISPMKALAVDIERNLRSPLTGVGQAARRLGLAEPDIRVGVRTGDTAADERRKLSGQPPDILITTPESLFLLLTSQARETLRNVETVIVDEVHALAGGKRGAHLALSLERLDELREGAPRTRRSRQLRRPAVARRARGGRPPRAIQRIGLSATVRPPEEVASFLGGSTAGHGCPAAQRQAARPADHRPGRGHGRPGDRRRGTGDDRHPDDPVRRRSIWPHVEERVLDEIEAHQSTIVFANSRRLAERLCARLNELAAERAEERAGSNGAPAHPAEVMAQAGAAGGCHRGGARAPRLGVPAGAHPDRGGAEGGPAAGRGGHVQPGARHRHGRG